MEYLPKNRLPTVCSPMQKEKCEKGKKLSIKIFFFPCSIFWIGVFFEKKIVGNLFFFKFGVYYLGRQAMPSITYLITKISALVCPSRTELKYIVAFFGYFLVV